MYPTVWVGPLTAVIALALASLAEFFGAYFMPFFIGTEKMLFVYGTCNILRPSDSRVFHHNTLP